MASISWSGHLKSHVKAEDVEVAGSTVREALDRIFADNPCLGRYVLDDTGAVRRHITIFINGESVRDRDKLSDPLAPDAEIFVMQALSGG